MHCKYTASLRSRSPMTDQAQRGDRFTALEDQYSGYTVRDPNGEKIGKVDDLFVDEHGHPEYFGVKMGFLDTSSTLIPADIATIDNERGFVEVSQEKTVVKDGPAFEDDKEITSEHENEVRSYYGLDAATGVEDRGVTVPTTQTRSVLTGNMSAPAR